MWEQKRPHRKRERGSQGRVSRRRERPQQTGRDGTAGVSSRVTSVAGADGFSVKPTTKLEFLTSHQPGVIRAGNEAGKTTMFRALVQTPSKHDRIPCGIPPPDPATDGRSCLHGHGRRVRRGWLSMSEAVRDCHRLRFGSGAPTGYALYLVESQLFPNPQQFPQMPQWLPGGEL